jgi:hypothetical protein
MGMIELLPTGTAETIEIKEYQDIAPRGRAV